MHEKTVTVNGIQSNYYLLIFVFQDKTVRMWNIESSDDIPVVLEHRKNIGLRIVQVCSTFYCLHFYTVGLWNIFLNKTT